MPVQNPRFAALGARPGEAAHWTLTAVVPQLVASFGAPARGTEDFEAWLELRRRIEHVDAVRAFFVAQPAETFAAWVIEPYMRAMPPGRLLPAQIGPGEAERFEQAWFDGKYVTMWAQVDELAADFGSGPERFVWDATFARQWSQVLSAPALFSDRTLPAESFLEPW